MQAAALGLNQIEENNLLDGCSLVGEATVEVVTRSSHAIQLSRLQLWLDSGGTPKEVAMKQELRERRGR